MIPTRRLAWLGAIATLVALVAGYANAALLPLLAIDGVILLAVLVDVLISLGKNRVIVERQAPEIFSVGRANAVTISSAT